MLHREGPMNAITFEEHTEERTRQLHSSNKDKHYWQI